ncbi:hypothetical protein PsYK624_053030 [Phanerochaete sordida]|uniref:Uncharacterized protein n=1 Tax=Phanerochaete sordida TaxID=48140 RepID=A0A9P3G4V9_9APHY|nr:hypothetical protein PsYK624_053030 [Phanerochaete sordida]
MAKHRAHVSRAVELHLHHLSGVCLGHAVQVPQRSFACIRSRRFRHRTSEDSTKTRTRARKPHGFGGSAMRWPSSRPSSSTKSTLDRRAETAFTRFDFPFLEEFVCRCGSTVPFRRILGRSLRRLQLYQCIHSSFPEQLVVLLSQVTQLEELVLENAFRTHPIPSDTTPSTASLAGPVTLARLRVLTIWDDDISAIAAVLDRLVHSARIYASFQIFHILPDTSSKMAQLFSPRYGTSSPAHAISPYPNSVSIVRRSANELELHYWEERKSAAELREERASNSLSATACYAFICSNADSRFIDALLSVIPLHDVKTALLVEPTVSGTLSWDAVLRSLASVEELGLEYETFRNGDAKTSPGGLIDEVERAALLPSVAHVYAWEHDHAHSALPPSVRHPLSTLQRAVHALSFRDASASLSPTERVSVIREVLDYHEDSGKVCLCDDLISLDAWPEVHLRPIGLAAPLDNVPRHDERRSWLGSQIGSLRNALRRKTRR